MTSERCPYFTIRSYELVEPGGHSLRVPIYRCAVSELALERLRTNDEARDISRALSRLAPDGERRPLYGPDMGDLSPAGCTRRRCLAKCRSGFAELMCSFNLESAIPPGESLNPVPEALAELPAAQ